MKIDTGADVNTINRTTFKKLFPNTKLKPSTVILKNFDSSYIQPMGKFKAFLCWKGKRYRVDIEVMDSTTTPNMLSRASTFCMGILKSCFVFKKSTGKEDTPSMTMDTPSMTTDTPSRTTGKNHPQQPKQPRSPLPYNINGKVNLKKPLTEQFIKSEFTEVFDRLGWFPGEPYKLKLKPDVIPAWHRPWKVPVHLEEAFHEEISRLCKIDLLEPVKDHTEWVNSYVIVEKEVQINSSNAHTPGHMIKKKLRICLDPKDLNEALEWEPYYSRTVDELISKFNGAIFFTIISLDKGYWQVILHPDSWKYTCMALDIGHFQWKRLPMGTIITSDVFQKKLDSIYIGLPPRSHRHRWWHDYLWKHQRWAWPEPVSISTSHKRQRTLPEQRQNTVQEDWSLLLWTQMVEGWTLTRPKEDTIDNQHGFSRGQRNNALFPRDGKFPKPILTMTGQALCTSQKSHSERHTLHSHRQALSSLCTTQTGIHNRNHASLFW